MTAPRITYEPGTSQDYPGLLALNELAVPAVNSINNATLTRLHAEAAQLLVARDNLGELAGFMLAMNERSRYDSVNFQYFHTHYDSFVYVDRIVVDPGFRGLGVGMGLYDALHQSCPEAVRITCEVNLKPPNPGSLAFHHRLGFEVVAEQDTDGGAKRVALMVSDRGGP